MKAAAFIACLLASLGWSAGTLAAEHAFWEVSGKHNTVYLLGSVHVSQGPDSKFPAAIDAAYLDAEHIVEELDLLAAGTEMASSAVLALQALPPGQTLAEVLGPELFAQLQRAAFALDIDTDSLARLQPWYVALMVMQERLRKAGFSSTDGLDYQIAVRAQRDSKPLRGLETAFDQLKIFAGMSLEEQRRFLGATLDEEDVGREVAEITAVWRRGDLKKLEALLREGVEESPEFFKALTTDRNLQWLPQIEAMLADPKDDYLVVTGALHMVGDMGVVELLKRKGYKVRRR